MLHRAPAQDMTNRNKPVQQCESRLSDTRFVKEFDDKRQIDIQPKHVRSVNLAAFAQTRNAAENNHALDTLLVVKNVQDLLHEGLAPPMFGFPEVDANHHRSE